MPIICPAILAATDDEYREQIEKVVHSANRIQIDLTDGQFASGHTVKPEQAWWPVGFAADLHLMFRDPTTAIRVLIEHKPNMIIVHAEASGNFAETADFCHAHHVKIGVALLQPTVVDIIAPALEKIDHVLIFSGNLGHQGGSSADFSLLEKVKALKTLKPSLEVGWDGGINDQNVAELVIGGVDVLNVGGYIQNAEDPARAIANLQRIADETGTT